MKVLIVDDALVIWERLALMLSEIEGVEVIGWARTGDEALKCTRELRPDLLILDIWMPAGSGLDVLRSLRSEGDTTQVIVLTNYSSEPYRRKCEAAGANYFLCKSMEFERLAEAVGEVKRLVCPTG